MSVNPAIETNLSSSSGHLRPRRNDQASIHGSHHGQRPNVPRFKGRTHDRKCPSFLARQKILANRGPSTHDVGDTEGAVIAARAQRSNPCLS